MDRRRIAASEIPWNINAVTHLVAEVLSKMFIIVARGRERQRQREGVYIGSETRRQKKGGNSASVGQTFLFGIAGRIYRERKTRKDEKWEKRDGACALFFNFPESVVYVGDVCKVGKRESSVNEKRRFGAQLLRCVAAFSKFWRRKIFQNTLHTPTYRESERDASTWR